MSTIAAIKTEQLDDEQEDIGIENNSSSRMAAGGVEGEGEGGDGDGGGVVGIDSHKEHRKPTSIGNTASVAAVAAAAGKLPPQPSEIGRRTSNVTAMRQLQQQQNQPQPAGLLKSMGGHNGDGGGRVSGAHGGGVLTPIVGKGRVPGGIESPFSNTPSVSHYNEINNKITKKSTRSSIVATKTPSSARTTLPKSRCGEVFVSKNARQWTFICTYCNKSTRDIGEFICHIRIKHLGGFGADGEDEDAANDDYYDYNDVDTMSVDDVGVGVDYEVNNQQSSFYEQDQDYMDCGSYLDVNVHTDAEDFTLNGHEQVAAMSYRNMGANNHHVMQRPETAVAAATVPQKLEHSKRQEIDLQRTKMKRLNSGLEDDLNASEHERGGTRFAGGGGGDIATAKESAAQWRADPAIFQSYANKQYAQYHTSTPDMKASGKPNKTENGSGSAADFDATDYALSKEEFGDTTTACDGGDIDVGIGVYNDDDEDDYDNQLLIAPSDSMDASLLGANVSDSGGGGGEKMKTKRRQIRGTAYCALCNKTFQYYSLYRNHMIKHSNETPFKCPICKKGFKSKQAIRYHMNTHQKEKQFKCTICGASYGTENHFISHIMSHENSTTFPCMVCGQLLTSSKGRDLHMAEHKEERPFRCDYCFKLFRLRHHLSNHLKMHRKYRCDYCKEIFTSAIYLRKPYACSGCESSPVAQQAAAAAAATNLNNKNATRGGGGGGDSVNPLEIFEAAIPRQQQGQPQQGGDYAQMVTDSEDGEDGEDDDNDDDDDDGEENEDDEEGDANNPANNEDDDDDDDDDDSSDDSDDDDASNGNGKRGAAATGDEGERNEKDGARRKAKRARLTDHGDEGRGGVIQNYDEDVAGGSGKRFECKYCHLTYSHHSGLSFHIRKKHC